MVFLVEKMGALIQAGKSLAGITAGTLLGLFSLGMFFPWANSTVILIKIKLCQIALCNIVYFVSKGALVGGITSTLLVGWISVGTQAAMAQGIIVNPTKPVSTEDCLMNVTSTMNIVDTLSKDIGR